MNKFVHDEAQLRKFYEMLPRLGPDETYFLSLSARNKYLTDEERKEFDLGRTEMFMRKVVTEDTFEHFKRAIYQYEMNPIGMTGRGFNPLPQKCLVIYANLNPSSGKKSLREFYSLTTDILFNSSSDKEQVHSYRKLETILLNCFQRNEGVKSLIDIDFDVPKDVGYDLLLKFVKLLQDNKIKYFVIETAGGYHVQLVRSTVKMNYNLLIPNTHGLENGDKTVEIVVNKNGMVPVPGTMAAGFPVRMLEI